MREFRFSRTIRSSISTKVFRLIPSPPSFKFADSMCCLNLKIHPFSILIVCIDHYGTNQPAIVKLVFGGIAGIAGQSSSYPLDIVRSNIILFFFNIHSLSYLTISVLIRRRMQTAKKGENGTYQYQTILGTLKKIYR